MAWEATLKWQDAQQRASLLQQIRTFFDVRNVTEVETPLLSHGTITDLHLEAFASRYDFLAGSNTSAAMYLQTSPEFAMKRLLASGYGDIFQLCKAFRHEASGKHHNPEFTILEWYRLGFSHFDLMDEVEELLKNVLHCAGSSKISYQQLFMTTIQLDPLSTTFEELLDTIKYHGKYSDWLATETNIDTLLQFIMSEIIEPTIGKDAPCFLYDFPASQASLAKISPKDSRVAERFECYYRGIELANGFNELTDAKVQVERFKQDNTLRIALGLVDKPTDVNFLSALESGLPACSGVALGIDRLIMLALNKNDIKNVLSFPVERA